MHTKLFVRFLWQFVVYLLLISALVAYPLYKMGTPLIYEGLGASMMLFFVLTIVSFFIIIKFGSRKGGNMINAFLGSIGLKMMVSLLYFLVLLGNFEGFELEFALTFFTAYLVCTGFEIYFLMSNLRQI